MRGALWSVDGEYCWRKLASAAQQNVDAVVLSILSGAHMTLSPRAKRLLDEAGMADTLLSTDSILPDDDMLEPSNAGVGRLGGQGLSLESIVS